MLSYKLEVSHHLRDFLSCTIVHIYHKYPKHHLDRPTLKTSNGTQTPVNYQIKNTGNTNNNYSVGIHQSHRYLAQYWSFKSFLTLPIHSMGSVLDLTKFLKKRSKNVGHTF